MGICCQPTLTTQYALSQFHTKNMYNPKQKNTQNEQKIKIILDRIAPGIEPTSKNKNQYLRALASYIGERQNLEFVDCHFLGKQIDGGLGMGIENQVQSLGKLFNFQRLRLERVYKNASTSLDVFNQQEVELCYLTSVFYLICQAQDLKQRIFVTYFVNVHSAYIIKLFCNGRDCHVVVDSYMPVANRNIKYLSIRQPQEIWPFLLEKAWCKQIGSYEKARGLSPEDCFQQITGIPAYSYNFGKFPPNKNFQILVEAKKKGYWIVFTATERNSDVPSRQVFFLQKINETTKQLLIRSPYPKFKISPPTIYQTPRAHNSTLNPNPPTNSLLTPQMQQSNFTSYSTLPPQTGYKQLLFSQLLSHFQYVTIGCYVPGYVPESLSFSSGQNEEKVFQLTVMKPGVFNVRFVQFYREYLGYSQKELYEYAPVLMELYDQKYKIVEKCEGRAENLEGIRSSNLGQNPFEFLKAGVYYLRIQVSWGNASVRNNGSIVLYAGRGMADIRKYQGDTIDFSSKLLSYTLQSHQKSIQKIQNKSQQLSISHLTKCYGHIIGIQNLAQRPVNLKLIFKQSYNIRVNHHSLDEVKGEKSLNIHLDANQERILEVLPVQPRREYYLAPFDIVKF